MPVAVSYPGVYVEEIPSGVRTITGVSTSIAAFVDYFAKGPTTGAVHIFSFADFERQFGGLDRKSEASYAIQQFFLNGGTDCYVVRTTGAGGKVAAINLKDAAGGTDVLKVEALNGGYWGNSLRVDVDYGTTDPTTQFNLTVSEVAVSNGSTQVVASEVYRNLVVELDQVQRCRRRRERRVIARESDDTREWKTSGADGHVEQQASMYPHWASPPTTNLTSRWASAEPHPRPLARRPASIRFPPMRQAWRQPCKASSAG